MFLCRHSALSDTIKLQAKGAEAVKCANSELTASSYITGIQKYTPPLLNVRSGRTVLPQEVSVQLLFHFYLRGQPLKGCSFMLNLKMSPSAERGKLRGFRKVDGNRFLDSCRK